MSFADIKQWEDALNKFNEFKTANNISEIMLNIPKVEGIEHVVFVKNFSFQDNTEKNIINSLPDDETIFIYRKINLNNKEKKLYVFCIFQRKAKAIKKCFIM